MANHFVRSGATGTGSGADWTNAFTGLPATLVRGDTYYIATGSYAGRTFNTAASGTQLITIKGATVADHGTETGWQASFSVSTADGGSQAVWTSSLTFNTSYWVFDGSVGALWSRTTSEYGFRFNVMSFPISIFNLSIAISDVTVSHIAATAPAGDVEKFFVRTDNSTQSIHRVTISSNYGSGWSNYMHGTSPGRTMDDWVVERNIILNGFSSAANHGECINNNGAFQNRLTIRYNWFEARTEGTGIIVVLNNDCGPYFVYGNVFQDMVFGDGGITGIINAFGTQEMSGVIYNNTFVNVGGQGGGVWIGTAVLSTVRNNVLYSMPGNKASSPSSTHNAFFSTTNTPSEPNSYITTGSPFVDEPNNDLNLTSAVATAMPAGETLAAPYNVDAFGNTRGADGKWDRGAYEFVTSGALPVEISINDDLSVVENLPVSDEAAGTLLRVNAFRPKEKVLI